MTSIPSRFKLWIILTSLLGLFFVMFFAFYSPRFVSEYLNANTVAGDQFRHRPYWYLLANRALSVVFDPARPISVQDFTIRHALDPVALAGFQAVLAGLNTPGNLNSFGKFFAKRILQDSFYQRDCVLDAMSKSNRTQRFRGHSPPIIVMGSPRSGTTFLHRLLSLDEENFRSPRFHEYMDACPRPAFDGKSESSILDRIRVRVQSMLMGSVRYLLPTLSEKHHVDATLPEEDVIPLAHVFYSAMLSTVFDLGAGYINHLKSHQAMTHGVKYLHDYLEYHIRSDDRRFLLKTPQHVQHIQELVERFPGCTIIWTHRDPRKTMASLISVTFTMWGMGTDQFQSDGQYISRKSKEVLQYWSWVLERGVKQRQSVFASSRTSTLIDIDFSQLTSDPLAQVKLIYAKLGLELKPKLLAQMQEFEREFKSHGQSGKHSYNTLQELGLDDSQIRNHFNMYYESNLFSK